MTTSLSHPPIPFVDLGAQHLGLSGEIRTAIDNVFQRRDFILGEDVRVFEAQFADYCGATHCAGVASGSDAIKLSLEACGVRPGDEVITSAHTFMATLLSIIGCGATPVLVDCEPDYYAMDPALVERAITSRTKAIVPVHMYGQSVDMDPLLEIARGHGLAVVEDACQAHGATYKGRRCGALGDIAAFSFYPSKNLGACGDGGAIVTNRADLDERVRVLRDYGQRAKYHHVENGYNSRLDTIQAAVLRVKLPHLDRWNAARRRIAEAYTAGMSDISVSIPKVAIYGTPVFHLYVVRTPRRQALQSALDAAGISHGVHYPIPTHLQQAVSNLGYTQGSFPVAEAAALEVLSLPMYPELADAQIERVIEVCRDLG